MYLKFVFIHVIDQSLYKDFHFTIFRQFQSLRSSLHNKHVTIILLPHSFVLANLRQFEQVRKNVPFFCVNYFF